MIRAGSVRVDGVVERRPGRRVAPSARITLDVPDHPYVSRGGLKLAGALRSFRIDAGALRVLDVGASTGGFTDCLLRSGAARVTALDVGAGMLDPALRGDPRVEVVERRNARRLEPDELPGPFDLVVVDVSFISLRNVLPSLVPRLAPGGRILALVKPQFELGPGAVRGGIVIDPERRREAVADVCAAAALLGLRPAGQVASDVPGKRGNRETFVLFETVRDTER
jgi:23S rRNA (cytidine1920-2'-O)/16S rRNA (cytidine1409-2'-O)-methyltransferase